ncbi:hypothetical protein [Photobacterium minamisatsumaniensis]|uniref:hypothetical protein n=1 Tax=Photobacterium minamisatsumaniensis TaxID=2910233 RepID=UPI003D149A64
MKLFASILTTGAIAGSILGLVVFQPVMAENAQQDQAKPALDDISIHTKSSKDTQQFLHGVTKTIPLQSISILWRDFENKVVEKNKLPAGSDRVIVLYQNFNSDFTEAKVTIGYPTQKNVLSNAMVELPTIEKADLLLSRGKHSESELIDAWSRINFQKSVEALVETHYLSPLGLPESSQLSVYYK